MKKMLSILALIGTMNMFSSGITAPFKITGKILEVVTPLQFTNFVTDIRDEEVLKLRSDNVYGGILDVERASELRDSSG